MKRALLTLGLAMLVPAAHAQHAHAQHDPVATDGDKYRVLLENEHVRVLAYDDRPGERTRQHAHPAFVVVALDAFERRLELADGHRLTRRFAAGDVLCSNGETHIGENLGSTPTRVVMIELKRVPSAAGAPPTAALAPDGPPPRR